MVVHIMSNKLIYEYECYVCDSKFFYHAELAIQAPDPVCACGTNTVMVNVSDEE